MTYDFLILTHPRSGAHMLASALNSHPDVSCSGDATMTPHFQKDSDAKLRGRIAHFAELQDDPIETLPKIIYLTRNAKDRAVSIDRMRQIKPTQDPPYHFFKPMEIDASGVEYKEDTVVVTKQKEVECREFLKDKEHIEITYEELTNNQNIDIIPEAIVRKLADYLNFEYTPLKPLTVKPTYHGNIR